MKYIYSVVLNRGTIRGAERIIRQDCSDYIKAMEAVKDAMEFAWQRYGVHKSCFNEILNIVDWFRKEQGYVRAWKAITDDIYVVHLYKIKLNNNQIKRWL